MPSSTDRPSWVSRYTGAISSSSFDESESRCGRFLRDIRFLLDGEIEYSISCLSLRPDLPTVVDPAAIVLMEL
jgi:hypothetical protein